MSDTIGENGRLLEWREREIHGGSTRAEMAETARNRTRDIWSDLNGEYSRIRFLPKYPEEIEFAVRSKLDQLVLLEQQRIQHGLHKLVDGGVISEDARIALIRLIYKKGEA